MKKLLSVIMAAVCAACFSLSAAADGGFVGAASCDGAAEYGGVTVLGASAFSFSAAKGTYSSPFYLEITAPKKAKVYYTTNGKTPTVKSARYSSPILIDKTTVVKAFYVLSGKKSGVKTVKYTMKATTPFSSVSSGVYGGSVCAELISPGADIYYTTDGTAPTKASAKYSDPILIDESCTLQAVAYKTGCSVSDIMCESYVILNKAPDDSGHTYDSDNSHSMGGEDTSDYWSDYWNSYWNSYWYEFWSSDWWGGSSGGSDGGNAWDVWDTYSPDSADNGESSDNGGADSGASDTDASTVVTYEWSDGINSWTWELEIPDSYYTYALSHTNIAADRVNYDYEKYVTDTYDDEYLGELAQMLKEAADSVDYDEDELLNMVITFVQSLDYVSDYESKGQAEYPKYPVETLREKGGDCEDLAALLTSLFKALGYDSCMLMFPDHMATGIAPKSGSSFSGTYFLYNGKKYYFVETTSLGWGLGDYSVNYTSATVLAV